MTRPARSLFAVAALAAIVLLLGSAVLAAGKRPAKPAAPPAPANGAAAADTPAVPRTPPDTLGPEWSESDSIAPPQLFLAWHQPYGMPGATDTISFGVGDSTRVDTLYMSFEPGWDIRKFIGMWARLYFHPAPGDTLGTYWQYDYGYPNYRNVEIQFDPDGSFPCPQPWIRNGVGYPDFDFDSHGARLDLFYVNLNLASIVPVEAGVRYCYARVMFRQRRWDLPGSRQPICLEWTIARFSAGARGDAVAQRGPARFVSINSPDRSVCASFRGAQAPASWVPPRPTR
jgi:hypothetical protein